MTEGQLLPLHTVTLLAKLNYHGNILKGQEYFARKGELLLQPLGHSTDFFWWTLYIIWCHSLKKKKKNHRTPSSFHTLKKTHQNYSTYSKDHAAQAYFYNMPVDQKSVIKATVWKNKQQI